MLRTRRLVSPACLLAGLLLASGCAFTLLAPSAQADDTDGTLTVVVELDVNGDGSYDSQVDTPQAGIDVSVSDAVGTTVDGTTDAAGKFEVPATEKLSGGRYFVVAQIPSALSSLTPVPESPAFVR